MIGTNGTTGAEPATIALEPSADTGIYEIESLCMNCHENVSGPDI